MRNDGERPDRDMELRRREARTLRTLSRDARESVERLVAGIADLPRKDRDPVFSSPWESRAFSMVLALYERGFFSDWEEFRSRLVAEIANGERRNQAGPEKWSYYQCWLAALERLVIEKGVLSRQEVDTKAGECAKDKGHAVGSHRPSEGGA